MAANTNSPQSLPLNYQLLINPRLGIKITSGLPKHLLQQEMTPSPLAPDEKIDNFLGISYRGDVEAPNDSATVTHFMKGSLIYVVQEPEVTDNFQQFLITMYGSIWEKRVLGYQTMTIEQLYALNLGYGKLTSRMKRAWLNQFYSWSPNQLRAQHGGLTDCKCFLEIE